MSNLRKALDNLEKVCPHFHFPGDQELLDESIKALRTELAQQGKECVYPECETGIGCDGPCGEKPVDTVNTSQERVDETAKCGHEPAAWYGVDDYDKKYLGWDKHDLLDEGFAWITPLYTAPPKREWVGLTDEEFKFIASKYSLPTQTGMEYFKDELETKLKEKNA